MEDICMAYECRDIAPKLWDMCVADIVHRLEKMQFDQLWKDASKEFLQEHAEAKSDTMSTSARHVMHIWLCDANFRFPSTDGNGWDVCEFHIHDVKDKDRCTSGVRAGKSTVQVVIRVPPVRCHDGDIKAHRTAQHGRSFQRSPILSPSHSNIGHDSRDISKKRNLLNAESSVLNQVSSSPAKKVKLAHSNAQIAPAAILPPRRTAGVTSSSSAQSTATKENIRRRHSTSLPGDLLHHRIGSNEASENWIRTRLLSSKDSARQQMGSRYQLRSADKDNSDRPDCRLKRMEEGLPTSGREEKTTWMNGV